MPEFLFVYGSLMPELGGAPFGLNERRRLSKESAVAARGTVSATLLDLGDYPGLVAPPMHTADRVHGTLLRLHDKAATFRWLDKYEDYDAARDVRENLYLRTVMPVEAPSEIKQAWVYVMRRVPPGSQRIASGMWHAPSPELGA